MRVRMGKLVRLPMPSTAILLILNIILTIDSACGSPVAPATSVTELIVEDPDDIRSQATPPPFGIHSNWTDWESWKASPDVAEAFPYYKVGHDLDGLAVYIVEFGKWDYREWAKKPEGKVEEFWKYFEQCIRREKKDAEVNNGEGMVHIVDWDGFSLSEYASPKAIKLAMKLFAGLLRVNAFTKYGFYVNVNFSAETFINAMRPFLGPFLEKFEICGTHMEKCKPGILKKINADQLPLKYGGTRSDWKGADAFNP